MSDTASGSGSSAVVVGGSLAGLTTALTLSREGVSVTVLECSGLVRSRGGGLAIPDGLVERVTGGANRTCGRFPHPCPAGHTRGQPSMGRSSLRQYRISVSPSCIKRASRMWGTTAEPHGRTPRTAGPSGRTSCRRRGHRSVVRRVIAPDHPEATYAGYLIWIGSIDEHDLPAGVRGDRRFDNTAYWGGGDEIRFGVPPRRRWHHQAREPQDRLGLVDLTRNAFLRSNGNVRNNVLHHSVSADDIPEHLAEDLVAVIRARWPSPWRDAMIASVHARTLVGTPISEYVPERLVAGRLALVGDAAHVATPMTGRGFTEALNDAEALATAARNGLAGQNAEGALRAYEQKRLHPARSTVRSGQDFSRSFSTA